MEAGMMKALVIALSVAVGSLGFIAEAAAMSQWERALIKRYTNKEKCDGATAPAWGRASMHRYQAAQRGHYR
jgi:hypothetical protein